MNASKAKRLALLAGSGHLPLVAAENAKKMGFEVLVVALTAQAGENFKESGIPTERVSPGKVGFCIRLLEKRGISRVLFIGKVEKKALLAGLPLDWLAIKEIVKLKERSDRAIMARSVEVLEERGFQVLPQSMFLSTLLAKRGIMGKHRPKKTSIRDFSLAFPLAKRLAGLGIGQTVVFKGGAVVAVEAVEGTDATIKRAGELVGAGITVVKAAQEGYNPKFDMPTVGSQTVQSIIEIGGGALGVEAGATVLVDIAELLALADANKIPVVGLDWGYLSIPEKPKNL
jgi:DUF1009 family protein